MKCNEIEFGTYCCTYNIMLPYKVNGYELGNKYVNIDKCLIKEIVDLWELGIKTTGCCCGHGRLSAFIGVENEYIEKMKSLGYKVQYNPCRPYDEDSFFPKTKFNYGEIK